ncbi:zinc ABC transporter ATP-binding protein AztA [Saxibacter everestensis]|uniref:Zinc ABC transporter ATP-binding protein AztA n=1 Tax=Saxibacter everestensis TaxID=2909229 RepID=A0ABY8QS68_9MICO|nr:zinc ABC transporter ATP-binding protein AztA [Brevibacteriaceae bacterium ZFBP1038]
MSEVPHVDDNGYHQHVRASITVSNVTCHYGHQPALCDINLTMPAGHITALTGSNGSGKTTVLSALGGILEPSRGQITGLPENVAFVLQRSAVSDQLPITVKQTVAMGRWRARGMFGRLNHEDSRIIHDSLEQMRISDLAGRRIGTLSGGQRQRCLVAQGLAQRPDLLLLDEPLAGVDFEAAECIARAIEAERSRGVTIVLATHDVGQAEQCDHVVHLEQGRVCYS